MTMLNNDQQKIKGGKKRSGKRRHLVAAFFLLTYALMGWLRLYNYIRFWDYMQELGIWPSPLYLALSGGLIGLAFSAALVVFGLGLKVHVQLVRLVGLVFLLWLWLDRILLSDRQTFIFLLPVTVTITLLTVFLMFVLIRPGSLSKGEKQDGS